MRRAGRRSLVLVALGVALEAATARVAGFGRIGWPVSAGSGGRFRPDRVAGFGRIGWPDSAGSGGRIRPDRVAGFGRITRLGQPP